MNLVLQSGRVNCKLCTHGLLDKLGSTDRQLSASSDALLAARVASMPHHPWVWVRLVVLFLAGAIAAVPAFGGGLEEQDAQIESLIEQVRAEPDSVRRSELAADLTHLIRRLPAPDQLDAHTIDELASLLTDRISLVRSWAAAALGLIGPTAARAVPALEKALEEAEIEENSAFLLYGPSQVDVIQVALERITGKPMPSRAE